MLEEELETIISNIRDAFQSMDTDQEKADFLYNLEETIEDNTIKVYDLTDTTLPEDVIPKGRPKTTHDKRIPSSFEFGARKSTKKTAKPIIQEEDADISSKNSSADEEDLSLSGRKRKNEAEHNEDRSKRYYV